MSDAPAPRIGKFAPGAGGMAKLTAKKRKGLAASSFAGPDRSFPIPDASHARNALARVANRSPELKARVRGAVKQKYPGIGQGGETGLINR